ncbi:MAG: hypothetical protein ACPGUV_01565 [Polyangiales bacterium]
MTAPEASEPVTTGVAHAGDAPATAPAAHDPKTDTQAQAQAQAAPTPPYDCQTLSDPAAPTPTWWTALGLSLALALCVWGMWRLGHASALPDAAASASTAQTAGTDGDIKAP